MSSASTSAGLPDGKYICYIKDEQIISIYSGMGMVSMGGMTRFNHEGNAYECVTSDLMDISRPVNDDGDKPDKDDPDDKGDKPDKDDDPDDNDDPDDEGIHINIMEAFLVIVSYFTSDFEYVLLF